MNVYDFDNTIYDGETLVDIVLYFMAHDKKIWKYIPKLIIAALKDKFHLFTLDEALEAYSEFLENYYITVGNIDDIIKKFWDKNEKKIKPFYETIRKDDDIIVSGTTDFLLDEIAKRMNIKHYICSSIDKETGKFKRLCFQENKVKYFHEDYPDAVIDNFYTDSMNDKAMMDISRHVFLVKKNKITQIKWGDIKAEFITQIIKTVKQK